MAKTSMSKDEKEQEQLDRVDELRRMQKAGKVPTVKANRDKNYEIPVTEEDYVHVLLTTKNIDAGNKSFTEVSKVSAFHASRFDVMVEQGAFQSFDDVRIIHDPREGFEDKVYSFKPERIEAASVIGAKATGNAKSADMKVINQAKKEIGEAHQELGKRSEAINEREVAIENKEKELADKESKIKAVIDEQGAKLETKEKTLEEREAALNAREQALASKEEAAKETPKSEDKKK